MSESISVPVLDPDSVAPRVGSSYPAPFREAVAGRVRRALGDPLGLTHYGVNLVELAPGAWSSQRHWHSAEDEFVYVLSGRVTLVSDAGRRVLEPGMAAGFPAGRTVTISSTRATCRRRFSRWVIAVTWTRSSIPTSTCC